MSKDHYWLPEDLLLDDYEIYEDVTYANWIEDLEEMMGANK